MVTQVTRMVGRKPTAADRLARQMQLLWQEHRSAFVERVDLIESARQTLEKGSPLTFAERAEAASAAHKLAGVLGIFDLKEGTEAARTIEQLLSADETHAAPDLTHRLAPHIRMLRAAIASR